MALAVGGGAVEASLSGSAGRFGVLVVALRSLPTQLPGLDAIWLDSGTAVAQAFGVLVNGTPLQSVTTLPSSSAFTGLAIMWQGLVFDAAGLLEVGNPAWFVLP